MKATILIGVFAAVFFTGAVYFSAGSTYAVYTAVVCMCLVIAMIRQVLFIDKQRKRWKTAPIPPDIKKFDVFFWNLLISQQDWYLENIYTKDDIKNLIGQYSAKISKIWADNDLGLQKKMEMVKTYMQRINSLIYHLNYVEPGSFIF